MAVVEAVSMCSSGSISEEEEELVAVKRGSAISMPTVSSSLWEVLIEAGVLMAWRDSFDSGTD